MIRASDQKSFCRTCGEEFIGNGNYGIKILPANRVPKKAKKIANALKGKSTKELSKFQKYMIRKANPTNSLEIKCGNCLSATNIRMKKPQTPTVSKSTASTPVTTSTPFPVLDAETKSMLRKQRKRQSRKDIHAGLTIPQEILNSNPTTPWITSSENKPGSNSSTYSSITPKLPSHIQKSGNSSSNSGNQKKQSSSNPIIAKKMKGKAKAQEQQRGLSKLKKVLFKSKQGDEGSGSHSFEKFLQ